MLFHVAARDRLHYEALRGELSGVESVEDVVVAKLVYGGAQDEEDVVAIQVDKGTSDRMKEKAGE